MANPFYIDPNLGRDMEAPSRLADSLSGLGNILQKKREDAAKKKALNERSEEARDVIDSGDPKKVFAPEQEQKDKQITEDKKPKKAKKKGKK